MSNWYTFESEELFNTWHEALKARLGYPIPSIDFKGNVIGEPYSTDYAQFIKVDETDYRAYIEDIYAEGLTLSTKPEESSEAVSF